MLSRAKSKTKNTMNTDTPTPHVQYCRDGGIRTMPLEQYIAEFGCGALTAMTAERDAARAERDAIITAVTDFMRNTGHNGGNVLPQDYADHFVAIHQSCVRWMEWSEADHASRDAAIARVEAMEKERKEHLKLMTAALTQLDWDYGTLKMHYVSKPSVIEPLRAAIDSALASKGGEG